MSPHPEVSEVRTEHDFAALGSGKPPTGPLRSPVTSTMIAVGWPGLEPLWAKPRSMVSCWKSVLTADPHANVSQLPVTGASRWSSPGHPAAWVKLRAGATVTEDEIRDFCRTRLTHFKTPRYVKFVESFPTTVTGKIQKFKIREQAILDFGLQDVAAIETA